MAEIGGTSLAGSLLVASPTLDDPNFSRSVILLLDHDGDGALGIILNRPSEIAAGDALPRWADVASEPAYVTGLSKSGLPTGWLATNVTVYTPVGAQLGSLRLGDGYVSGTSATQDGRAVQVVTSWLAPGQQVTYRATVPVHGGSLTVWSTPTLTSNGRQTVTCGG